MHLSFWQQDAFFKPADVVIAGSGFMGLWSAYELKKQHSALRIVVLERDNLPGGASVRNAGFACFGSPGELLADAETMGEHAMWQLVEMRYKGIQKIRQLLGDAAINYDACGGYECFADAEIFAQVADKLPWLNDSMKSITGNTNAFTVADTAIAASGMKNFEHLITNRLEGGLHSGKTIQALLQIITALGVTVLYGTALKSWTNTGKGLLLELGGAYPATMFANKLLITTNAFASQLAEVLPVYPARGQVLVTQPVEGLQLRGTFHYDTGYYYWRNVGNRILLGGARNQAFDAESTSDLETSGTIQDALEQFIYRHFALPNPITIEYRWAGIMGFTQTKQPILKAIEPGVWAAIACNGMGVALSPMMAEQVVTQMMG